MSKKELRESLAQLRAEIEALEESDDALRNRLTRLVEEVEEQLQEADHADAEEGHLQKIRKAVEQFEVEHPRITGLLNRIMMTLSDMGI